MDYYWAGSASYLRFNKELSAVAAVFGGFRMDDGLAFPVGTHEILVKWFNDPYDDYTLEETKIIWEHVQQHPEIEEISEQIWYELKTNCEFGYGWSIY